MINQNCQYCIISSTLLPVTVNWILRSLKCYGLWLKMKIIHLQSCSWFLMLILYTFTNLSELHTSLNTWWRLVAVGAAGAEANCPHWETTATVAPQMGPSEKWPGVSEDLLVLQKYNWNASIILNLYKMNCTKIFSSSTFNQHIEIIFYLNLKYN